MGGMGRGWFVRVGFAPSACPRRGWAYNNNDYRVMHGKTTTSIPSLDGIRAVSVALVFFSHNGLGNIVPGGLGVTIFFVLSGYLITTLMRTEYAAHGTVSFRAFYLRRFLRLTPPLAIVTCLAVALSLILGLGTPFTPTGLLSVLLYFSNYFVIFNGAQDQPPGLGVTWSLAVEEHYYLLFPPLALTLLRFRKAFSSVATLTALCLGVLAWRCWLAAHGAPEERIGMATDTRVDAILIGCLLAMVRNPWLAPPQPGPPPARELAFAAACLGLLVGTLLWRDEFFRQTFRYTLQSLSIAGLLYLAVARSGSVPFRWLNARPLVYLGTVSYTIYLAHYVMLLLWEQYLGSYGKLAVGLVTAATTLCIAELMRRWVEAPCAALRRRLHESFIPKPAGTLQQQAGTSS
jgi:peptidoglycan/LPS O-acetylase OafA/YrhL